VLPQDSDSACRPLHELEHLARLPHIYDCPLWLGHAVANGTQAGGPEPLDHPAVAHATDLVDSRQPNLLANAG
jgi:hypothetical protein